MDGLTSVRLDVASMGTVQPSTQLQRPHKHPGMDAAANLLGMSESDLRTAMQSGQSLSSIASSKGVSQDQLVAAMSTAIEQANPGMSADQATSVAMAIATRTPGARAAQAEDPTSGSSAAQGSTGATQARGHHGHRHHVMASAMQAAAQTIGESVDQLASSLQSGQSITSLAASKGVSQVDLANAISTAVRQVDPSMSAEEANHIATRLTSATPEAQPWSASGSGTSTFGVSA